MRLLRSAVHSGGRTRRQARGRRLNRLLIFGEGYVGKRLRGHLEGSGWRVTGTSRKPGQGQIAFDDPALPDHVSASSHLLSSVPPSDEGDPVLARYGEALANSNAWLGYLSSTGVYGDVGGAWVDESAPIGSGRRTERSEADVAWQGFENVHIFRLPGIYGPGRTPFERIRANTAKRVDAPDQVFSRIHVDDICAAIAIAMERPRPGIYNIADDHPAPGHEVTAFAAQLIGKDPPPLVPLEKAQLSPAARGFYAENRRVANGKMRRDLGVALRYPDYRRGLAACLQEERSSC